MPRHSIYAASKAAVQGMVECLAVNFGPKNITVNRIAPGGIKSDMFCDKAKNYIPGADKLTSEEIDTRAGAMSPSKRPGVPDDFAGLVSLIASPEAQWMTGQTFYCSGGVHMATA